MNDKNKSAADIVDIDDAQHQAVEDIDLDALYNEVDLEDVGDVGGFDEAVVPVSPVPSKNGREKLWLILTGLFFVLALISSVVLPPAISVQTQRVDQVAEIIDKVNLTNISATQALSPNGRFDGVKKNLVNAEESVAKLVSPQSGVSALSSVLFNNSDANESVKKVWANYKGATDSFIKSDNQVTEVKRLAVELDGAIATSISESVGFLEAVSREGRNKSDVKNKDKYLFLTSEASNLNGILSRLSSSMRAYFNAESDFEKLSGRQNNLMIRLQDTLSRIVSNSEDVVGAAAEPLQQNYAALEAQVTELGQKSASVVGARKSLIELSKQSSELSKVVNAASNQTSLVNVITNLSRILPIIFGLLGAFALWRYTNAQTKELVEHDADLEETLADQQESILKLLDEMSDC